jgi:hypothetical protein
MLSRRSIILDSLSTHRVDEGMLDSISKNSSTMTSDKLFKALLSCDINIIPSKNIRSNMSFYNKLHFDDVDFILDYKKLPNSKGRHYYIYHLVKNKKHYIMISASSYSITLSGLSRCFIYEARDESVVDYIWDLVDKNKVNFDINQLGSGLKGCKTVADTYRVFGSTLLATVYGTTDDMRILEDTEDVMGVLFESSMRLVKDDYKGDYKSDMSELSSLCSDYVIKLNDDVLSVEFYFKDIESTNKAYAFFNKNLGRKSNLYSFYSDGIKCVGLEFYI